MHGDLEPEENVLDWRKEYSGLTNLSKYQHDLLENGPHSLAQSWMMQAMHNDWKRRKGIKDPEPPNCQSNLKDSLKMFDDYSDPYGGH